MGLDERSSIAVLPRRNTEGRRRQFRCHFRGTATAAVTLPSDSRSVAETKPPLFCGVLVGVFPKSRLWHFRTLEAGMRASSVSLVARRSAGLTAIARLVVLCIQEARPVVQCVVLLRFVTAVALAPQSPRLRPAGVVLVAVAWCSATVFVYLLNGVVDAVPDRLNGQRRPIATGQLWPSQAAPVAVLFALAAVLLAGFAGPRILVLTLGYLALGWAYSMPPCALKRSTVAAAAVVTLAGLATYAAGVFAMGGQLPDIRTTIFGIWAAAWMGLVGAVAKDFSDIYGDRRSGRRTAVISWGARRARSAVAAGAMLAACGLLGAALTVASGLLVPAVVAFVGAVAVAWSAVHLERQNSRHQLRRPYRLFMLTQYATHIAVLAVWLLS